MEHSDEYRIPFERQPDGHFAVNLTENELEVIEATVSDLGRLLSTDSQALRRLFPPPYGDDEERNRGYAALAGSELVERRMQNVQLVVDMLHAEFLSEEDLSVLMRTINDVRLVIGTTLDIDDDDWEIDAEDPNVDLFAVYEFLGRVLEVIIEALSGGVDYR